VAQRSQPWFPRVLRPGYAWAIQALLRIPIAGALIASEAKPQLIPAFIGGFALASLIQALVLLSALLSVKARGVLVAAGVPSRRIAGVFGVRRYEARPSSSYPCSWPLPSSACLPPNNALQRTRYARR
jgi:hypothetical protein